MASAQEKETVTFNGLGRRFENCLLWYFDVTKSSVKVPSWMSYGTQNELVDLSVNKMG